MRRSFQFLVVLSCMTAVCLLLARSRPSGMIVFPAVALDTAEQRGASMEALRAAWEGREQAQTTAARNDERAFINRMGRIAYRLQSTESAGAAASLLHQAYREHAAIFPGDR